MRKWSGALPYTVLLAEVLLFFRKVLFSSDWSIPWDLRGYHLPLATYIAQRLGAGHLPLWDPYTYCGFPFYANLQTQLFYPPAWPAFLAASVRGGRGMADLLEWQIVLHVFLGGVFAYLLLRKLGCGRAAGILGATVFQLGGYFASQTQHLGAMNTGTWLPLAWLSILHLSDRLDRRWLGILAASLALSVLAGFPAAAIVVWASCFLLAAALMLLKRASWKLAAALAVGYAWAALLAAVLLLPAMEQTGLSTAPLRGQWGGNGGGVPLQALVSMIVPDYYHVFDLSRYKLPWNPTFLYLYCSVVGLMLAVAVVACRRGRYWAVFALVTLLSAFWMLGESTPVGRTVYPWLPMPVKSALYAESAMLAFVLGVAVLAGLGAQEFIAARSGKLAVLAVAVVAGELILVGSGRPMNTGPNDRWLVTPDRFEGNAETLALVRRLVNQTDPPARVEGVHGPLGWTKAAQVTLAPTGNGDEPQALLRLLKVRSLFAEAEPWSRYIEPSNLSSPVLSLLNVRYVITRLPELPGGLVKLWEGDGQSIYESRSALPRFFLVGSVRQVRGMEEGLRALRESDPRSVAVVEGPVTPDRSTGGEVSVIRYEPERILLEIDSPEGGFLVTSETWYPGWRASIDGLERPLALTNVAFRGLPVPSGKHAVEMRFEPSILKYGACLTLVGIVLLLGVCVFGDNVVSRN